MIAAAYNCPTDGHIVTCTAPDDATPREDGAIVLRGICDYCRKPHDVVRWSPLAFAGDVDPHAVILAVPADTPVVGTAPGHASSGTTLTAYRKPAQGKEDQKDQAKRG